MNIFSRSYQGLNLTPGERAFMKLVEGWLFTALGVGGAIAYQAVATGNHDYRNIALVAGGAAALSVLNAFKKYLAAQTDLPLSVSAPANAVTDAAIQEVQKLNSPPPVTAPTLPTPVAPVQQFAQPQPYVLPQPFNAMGTATTPQTVTAAVPISYDIRHFGDSQIIPAVPAASNQVVQ